MSSGTAQAASLEARVKAAFLYKFAGFAEWPPRAFDGPQSPLVIGIVDSGVIARELQRIVKGRSIGGRPVVVRSIDGGEIPGGMHMLFIGGQAQSGLKALLSSVSGPVLTVTEAKDALEQGANINFVVVGGRVRFEVSMQAVERSGVRLSSRMLAVAQNLRPVDRGLP